MPRFHQFSFDPNAKFGKPYLNEAINPTFVVITIVLHQIIPKIQSENYWLRVCELLWEARMS